MNYFAPKRNKSCVQLNFKMNGMKGEELLNHLNKLKNNTTKKDQYYLLSDFFACTFLYSKYSKYPSPRIVDIVNKWSLKAFDGKYDYVALPICTDLDEDRLVKGEINFDDISKPAPMRHWLFAVIHVRSNMIELFNSIDMPKNTLFWADLIRKWVFDYTKETFGVITFQPNTEHQKVSLNDRGTRQYSLSCGLFVCLYFHLHLMGYGIKAIERHYRVSENYVENYYLDILNKHFT